MSRNDSRLSVSRLTVLRLLGEGLLLGVALILGAALLYSSGPGYYPALAGIIREIAGSVLRDRDPVALRSPLEVWSILLAPYLIIQLIRFFRLLFRSLSSSPGAGRR